MATTQERNKALTRRIYEELYTAGRLELADELYSADFKNHAEPTHGPGPEPVKCLVVMLRTAFTDGCWEIDDLLAEGDRVVLRTTYRGTHLGPFRGHPATGRSFAQPQIHIQRFAGGRTVEHWAVRDTLGLLRQLGLLPQLGPPPQPGTAK